MAKMVKKKPDTPPHEEHADETWLIPYSDLLTLLLALFIVLFASSSLDKDKAAQIQYALAAGFNTLPQDKLSGTILNFCKTPKTSGLKTTMSSLLPTPRAPRWKSTASVFLLPEAPQSVKRRFRS